MTQTIYLLDEIRNQFDLTDEENVKRYQESTNSFREPAKQLAEIYKFANEKEKLEQLTTSWNLNSN